MSNLDNEQPNFGTPEPEATPAPQALTPDQQLAAITRADWEKYQNDFLPVEQQVIADVSDSTRAEALGLQAGNIAQQAVQSNEGAFTRDLTRSGTGLSAAQLGKIEQNADNTESLARVNAINSTRRAVRDQDTKIQQSLLEGGQSLRGKAIRGLTSAANLQTQREATGQQIGAAQSASTMGAIGTGAGMGFMVGGAPGAVIGGGIGLLTSLF